MLVDVSNLVGPHHSFPRSGKKMMDIFPSCAVPWVKPARPQLGFCDKDLWFEGTRTANPCFFFGGGPCFIIFHGSLQWFPKPPQVAQARPPPLRVDSFFAARHTHGARSTQQGHWDEEPQGQLWEALNSTDIWSKLIKWSDEGCFHPNKHCKIGCDLKCSLVW